VWRWLRGGFVPSLAVEGREVAVGEPWTAPPGGGAVVTVRHMRVRIIDARSGAVRWSFVAPTGGLAFASPQRLVVTVGGGVSRAGGAAARASLRQAEPFHQIQTLPYHSYLYSTAGRRLAELGTFFTPPRVSHMHLLSLGGEALEVRSLPDGRPTPLIAFSDPQRTMRAVAFDWPALVLEETTASQLPAEQVNCRSGYYSEPSKPFLQIIDLSRPFAFEAAPSPSPLIAQNVLATKKCPPIDVESAKG
jgi:hypothetical protein